MDIHSLYERICNMLPITWLDGEVLSFQKKLSSQLDQYWGLIKEIDIKDRPAEWDDIKITIKSLNKKIVEIINDEYKGYHSTAFMSLRTLLEDNRPNTNLHIKDSLIFYDLPEMTKTYRIRMFDFDKRKGVTFKDMFHIPFDKRGIVKTERFSMPGYPCLYLGKSAYGCWEEIGQPSVDNCMVSCLENQETVKLIDLRIPTEAAFRDRLKDYLIILPIIISCMVQVKNRTDVFKAEYLIPQLIIEWLIYHNKSEHDKILGVTYTSSAKNNSFGFPPYVFDNYAIPAVMGKKNSKYSSTLCRIFRITNPTCDEFESIVRGPYARIAYSDPDPQEAAYKNSLFGALESALSERERFPFNHII